VYQELSYKTVFASILLMDLIQIAVYTKIDSAFSVKLDINLWDFYAMLDEK